MKIWDYAGLIDIKGAGEAGRLSVKELSFAESKMNNNTQLKGDR